MAYGRLPRSQELTHRLPQTNKRKLHPYVFKEMSSNRIVGYSAKSTMKSQLPVTTALSSDHRPKSWACIPRGGPRHCAPLGQGIRFQSHKRIRTLTRYSMMGSVGRIGAG